MAVEANLRKQAEVMHGIDANMQAFGDILQQNASSQQVRYHRYPSGMSLAGAMTPTLLLLDYAWNVTAAAAGVKGVAAMDV